VQASKHFGRSEAAAAALTVVAAVGYALPWATATASALTFSAYDLAEWTSLIPGVRYGVEPMAVPGQLRAVLISLTLLVVLLPARRKSTFGVVSAVAAIALVVAQLPPLEYFMGAGFRADVNYGQQFTFSLLALIGATLCWMVPRGAPRTIALVLTGASGAVIAVTAAARGLEAMAGLAVGFSLGIGPWITAGSIAALAVIALRSYVRPKSKGAP